MKILIIGNIGSGKTTLGKKIQEISGYEFVQIDELREEYMNNSVSGEYYSLYKFIKNIEDNNNLILEFTGVGCHKYAIKRTLELSNDKIIVILCKTRDFNIILKRIENKSFAYTSPFNTDIKAHSQFVNEEIRKDLKINFWNCESFDFIEVFMDSNNDLNVNIEKIKRYLF